MSKRKFQRVREVNQILPQLNNCNMIANHWARELLTIFEPTCVKEWKENQHLKVQVGGLFIVPLRLHKRPKKPIYSLIISSSKDILSREAKTYAPNTLILIGSAKTDECTLTWWDEKDNANPLFTIKKYNGTGFILVEDSGNYLMQYLRFKSNYDNAGRLRRFVRDNLYYQGLKKTRSKGGRISNQNSEVQSTRKLGKPVVGSTVILEWPNRMEQSTMLDAHKIVSSGYGYTKSYRTFVRELRKSGENPIKFNKNAELLEVSLKIA